LHPGPFGRFDRQCAGILFELTKKLYRYGLDREDEERSRAKAMNFERSGPFLRQVSVLFRSGTVAGMTDGQLLERFARRRGAEGEPAFAALVARHGPMVLGVCRQLLRDPHDADDAFQATFLTLARKAGSLRQPERLGPWLYGVAVRKTRKLNQQRERRWRYERRRAVATREWSPPESRAEDREESAVLHEELARLPEKYRTPIVLCYLQGHTHETAAAALGWPLGTVRGRLARAREQLRTRLAGRGVAPAGVVLGAWPLCDRLRAIVPSALSDAAVSAASQMAGGRTALLARLPAMIAARPGAISAGALRIAALSLLAGVVATGSFALGRRAPVAEKAALARGPDADVDRPEAGSGQVLDDVSPDRLPRWVSDAVRNIEPEVEIVAAVRESDTAYVVVIRTGGGERSLRVTGRFDGGRKVIVVRRIRDRYPEGRRV
jgi:RNA polymerase sigma factor (sigma-70 family)